MAKIVVFLDKKNRRGKMVTVVSGIQHNPDMLAKIAAELKKRLGSGGTVEGRDIVIQGDHRERVAQELEKQGYVLTIRK